MADLPGRSTGEARRNREDQMTDIIRLNASDNVVTATRAHPDSVLGVSPRGAVAVQRCAQALALIRGRTFVTPDDIKSVAPVVMSHRILPRDRRPDTARQIVLDVMDEIQVPVG